MSRPAGEMTSATGRSAMRLLGAPAHRRVVQRKFGIDIPPARTGHTGGPCSSSADGKIPADPGSRRKTALCRQPGRDDPQPAVR